MKEAVAILLIISASVGYGPPEEIGRTVDPTTLSLAELAQRLEMLNEGRHSSGRFSAHEHFEALLREIIKRGEPDAESILAGMVKRDALKYEMALRALKLRDTQKRRAAVRRYRENLELLTALRRMQQKPDPLVIEVTLTADAQAWSSYYGLSELAWWKEKYGPSPMKALENELTAAKDALENAKNQLFTIDQVQDPPSWMEQQSVVKSLAKALAELQGRVNTLRHLEELAPGAVEAPLPEKLKVNARNLPTFVIALKSADIEQIPLWLKKGGDTELRCRFEIKDAAGTIIPIRPLRRFISGMYIDGILLESGQTWKVALPFADYAVFPSPGEYTATMLYSNRKHIAGIENIDELDDLILFRSKPFKLMVSK